VSARQALDAALDFAFETSLPLDAQLSLPVPGRHDGRTAVRFALSRVLPAAEAGAVALFEPEAVIVVDAESGEVISTERRRSAVDIGGDEPLCGAFSDAAANLPPEHRAALQFELLELAPRVGDLFARGTPDTSAAAELRRYSALLRFLTPQPLLPHYQRLSPEFFDWLQVQTGTPLTEPVSAPWPKSASHRGASRRFAMRTSRPAPRLP
jgi:hypothetical protein